MDKQKDEIPKVKQCFVPHSLKLYFSEKMLKMFFKRY